MVYTVVRDIPRFLPKKYRRRYRKACKADKDNSYDQMVFYGKGITPNEHPQKDRINFSSCGNCKSDNVLVIYTQWSVSLHSGDCYWDYEIACNDCGKFTTRAYAEND